LDDNDPGARVGGTAKNTDNSGRGFHMRGFVLACGLLLLATADPCPALAQGAAAPPARYSGGDGLTLKKAVVIAGVGSVSEGMAAEQEWIRIHYPGAVVESKGRVVGPPHYDVITLKLASGSRVDLHFDITGFFVE
jgi:hypothetical protein